ncbi:TadE/TadG family type IV pilus assembly protein [uncultured Sneathiella sp.]|jgi:Flp pilus assembly pilin Flp|uniref:TadE/TadG family type IV pilus assembly protein n=1 Tax=uncultured Sneathiella sp. TaxID=879315 RepID=UPI0030DB0D0B|tara:strand:- start:35274 stop:35903 length:630 start_codon:yes stop_codon:yes gene_type:complete
MSRLFISFSDKITHHVQEFIRNHRGVAMVEFAMLLPLLMLLTAGSFEVARYALMTQKLDRITATLSDLIARSGNETITETEISNIIDSALFMAQPFDISDGSVIFLTSVQGRAGDAPEILSQRVSGNLTGYTSAIGSTIGGDATLPTAFPDAGSGETLADGETLIIAEIIYDYSPYLTGRIGFFGDMALRARAYFRPRFTDTITFPAAP